MGAEVYFANGLRKIKPYTHSRVSFAKGRWLDRSLLEILSDEFRAYPRERYEQGIQALEFQIIREGTTLSVEETLQGRILNKDVIKTTFHKHEPPVRQWCEQELTRPGMIAGIKIIHECPDLLVVDKPSGIPIHPTGQYYQNTIVEILKNHGKIGFPSHRLDKVTSGVLVLAKNPQTANEVQHLIRERSMNKIYLAKVEGHFPNAEVSESFTPFEDTTKITLVDSPIYSIELKKQFPAAFSPAREAQTQFYPLTYYPNSNETLVACKPITGRTHQIRIHLARIGHPIVNDTFYNKKTTKYPSRLQFMLECNDPQDGRFSPETLESFFSTFVTESDSAHGGDQKVETCSQCSATLFPDPIPSELELYLHAWKYSDNTGRLSFQSDIPRWAYAR